MQDNATPEDVLKKALEIGEELGAPAPGSKPAPPAAEVKAARDTKRNAPITLAGFVAQCRSAGAEEITVSPQPGGATVIQLRGEIGGRGMAVARLDIGPGEPFDLGCRLCLEKFKAGVAKALEGRPPIKREVVIEDEEGAKRMQGLNDVFSIPARADGEGAAAYGTRVHNEVERLLDTAPDTFEQQDIPASPPKPTTPAPQHAISFGMGKNFAETLDKIQAAKDSPATCKKDGCTLPPKIQGCCTAEHYREYMIADVAKRQGRRMPS